VPPSQVVCLPQRPYVVPGASLRLNLLYPADECEPIYATSDGALLEALGAVGLTQLRALDAPCDGLSPGELQRLSLARLLLRKPAIALLDEPCASCDPAFEAAFFERCAREEMTLLTVSHRREVAAHFTHRLRLDGAGGATLSSIDTKGDDSSASDDFVHAEH